MADVTCVRCGETKPGLAFAPFNNELGKRLHAEGQLPNAPGGEAVESVEPALKPSA